MSDVPRISRRALLGGSAAAVGAVGLGAAGGAALQAQAAPADWGASEVRPFHGPHQTAIYSPPTAHARYMTFDLLEGVEQGAIRRMLRIISEDAAALTQGQAPIADPEPELSVIPANLMISLGFGEDLVRRAGGETAVPGWLKPLPAFGVDKLEERYTGGDLLVVVQSDDPITISHAARTILRQTVSFVSLRWVQDGFRRAHGSEPEGTTMRNLFGQVDGTKGPHPSDDSFAQFVWGEGLDHGNPAWLQGGTGYVLRRITMDLDTWDTVDRPDRERSMGRTLANGAPLTGESESDEPDYEARNELGLPVIPDFAHMRRAHSTGQGDVISRRGYNFEADSVDGPGEAGLLFEAFAVDPVKQFVPIQRRLDELDMLNLWTTPTGSAVYAFPPGCQPGGYIGDTLV